MSDSDLKYNEAVEDKNSKNIDSVEPVVGEDIKNTDVIAGTNKMEDESKFSPDLSCLRNGFLISQKKCGKDDRKDNILMIPQQKGTKRTIFLILGVFLASIGLLGMLYARFPQVEENEQQYLKLPRNIEEAKALGNVLNRYKDRYYSEVLLAVFITYIFLQTFAIPGSIFLSILSGFLFQFSVALVLICFCSATGASFCYGISYLIGRRLVLRYFPSKVAQWSATVQRHKGNLINYIVFLRVTPFLPNWFINIASPVINVPLFPFWLGTFLGVAPPSIVAIQAGTTLNKMTSSSEAVSYSSVLILIVVGIISLLPVLFKEKLKKKMQ